jgi:DNA-binding GntR family transcriptional regulator
LIAYGAVFRCQFHNRRRITTYNGKKVLTNDNREAHYFKMNSLLAIEILRERSLSSVIEGEIERLILNGEIAPGCKINENQLALRFGTSRGPIREALRSLEGAGLVETIPNRGAFVCSIGVDNVREIYEVRAALFALAGRLLAERATTEIIATLDGFIARMEQAAQAHDFDSYYALNIEFHAFILNACGNSALARQYRTCVQRLTLFRARSLIQGGGLGVSNREHRAMVEAIRARDPDWAHEAHWRHVTNAKNRLLAVVREQQNAF